MKEKANHHQLFVVIIKVYLNTLLLVFQMCGYVFQILNKQLNV